MLKPLLVPGGILFLLTVLLLETGALVLSPSLESSIAYVAFAAGVLLAWRFHAGRVFAGLLFLLLSHHALEFFAVGHTVVAGQGRIAFDAICFLLPLNFALLALAEERGWSWAALLPWLGILFVESVFVAVICRPGQIAPPGFLHPAFFRRSWFHGSRIPQLSWLMVAAALTLLFARLLRSGKPVEGGLLWSLAAALLSLQSGGVGRAAGAYFSLSGLILASSIVESSYLLAYHDELTGLPGRRAFHNALFRLGDQFVIAAVDIDHFKSFNDTYGHETGDQVLRMVAARLAKVGGGGEAFRVGGEEFLILFPGKTLSAILPYAENLRLTVEETRFRTRAITERRRVPRPDADRRKARNSTRARRAAATRTAGELSVTISIGVAAGHAGTRTPESVQQAADRALYRAKDAGRNRVEIAGPSRTRARRQIA